MSREDWFNVVFYSIVWYIFAHTNDSNISLQLIVIASIKLSVEYKTKEYKPFFVILIYLVSNLRLNIFFFNFITLIISNKRGLNTEKTEKHHPHHEFKSRNTASPRRALLFGKRILSYVLLHLIRKLDIVKPHSIKLSNLMSIGITTS